MVFGLVWFGLDFVEKRTTTLAKGFRRPGRFLSPRNRPPPAGTTVQPSPPRVWTTATSSGARGGCGGVRVRRRLLVGVSLGGIHAQASLLGCRRSRSRGRGGGVLDCCMPYLTNAHAFLSRRRSWEGGSSAIGSAALFISYVVRVYV